MLATALATGAAIAGGEVAWRCWLAEQRRVAWTRATGGQMTKRSIYTSTGIVAQGMTAYLSKIGGAPIPKPEPRLRALLRVIPINQSIVSGDTEVALISVESYDDGFVLTARFITETSDPLDRAVARHPELKPEANDDLGRGYEGRQQGGGGGGGGPRIYNWRSNHRFQPALDHRARALRVTIPELRWRHFHPEGRDPAAG